MAEIAASPRESVFGSLSTTQFKKRGFRFKWTINEFSFYLCEWDNNIVSSIFSDGTDDGLKWRLEILAFLRSPSRIRLNLHLVSSNINHINTQCKFGILNANLEEVNKMARGFTFSKDDCQNSIKQKFNQAVELLPNDALTIFCEIEVETCDDNNPGALALPTRLVSNNLGLTLLENTEFSDITLCAGGKEIQAHKAILAAQSNVFSTMFKNNTKENQTNIVKIPDMDYEILEKLLRFIYTDQFPNLHTVTDFMCFWNVADKYELDRLKLRCEEELGMNLSDQNAVECYIAADKVNAEHLKASTKAYIITKGAEIATISGFPLLVHNHFDLVLEALRLRIPTIRSKVAIVPRLQESLFFESL